MSIEHRYMVGQISARWDRRNHGHGFGPTELVLAGAATAVGAGWAVTKGEELLALFLCLAPLVVWLLTRPMILLIPLGASIPAVQSLTGEQSSYRVSVGDLVLVLVGLAVVLQTLMPGSMPAVRALRPVALPVLVYSAVILLVLAMHPGIDEVLNTGQRYALLLLPLVVGAFAALSGRHIPVLQAYVIAVTVLAVVWPFEQLGLQKNPVGQLIANGVLLLVGMRKLRRLLPCLVILAPGLLLTESRGAIVATIVGIGVIAAIQGFGARPIFTRIVPLGALLLVAFYLMPPTLQERLTTFSAGTDSAAGYSITLRQQQAEDAYRLIEDHPWTGVGIGNYLAGDPYTGNQVDDPHAVHLLEAAEGGYLLAAAFVLLIAGSALALYRMRDLDVAPAAAAVLLATATHGLVDVYWVRGTPVLGWLLVGMACGSLALRRRQFALS